MFRFSMRDARALQLRGYINPKHNYKRDKRANFGKQFFQVCFFGFFFNQLK